MARGLAKRAPETVEEQDKATTMVVGSRCLARRQELEKTRLEVANEAGIDPSSLYRFEMGKQALSVPKVARVAKVLGLSLDELVAP